MQKRYIISAIFAIAIILLSACGAQIENGVDWPIEDDFEFTDQNGEIIRKSDLEGKVWVSNFIFTSCETVCPPMTANMARLQGMIEEEGLENVELVSFSVDPDVDTPEVLKEYALTFTENLDNWHFLTGYAQNYIEQFAELNFHAIVSKPENDDQVIHGTDFYLVDQGGTIVKYYSGVSSVPYEEIISDIKILLNNNK